jgi:EmrB/QacA subfamily drug resistance transporter
VSRKRVILVTVGVMLSLFMASMEATVVATAMPTIVAQLGGLASYSWVFSAFMLASTTMVPIFGKLSDLHGRKPIYAIAVALFLTGSMLSGLAQSMGHLIAARAVQGVGAGGLLALAFIIVGDMFTLEERARMQGLFSGVWGVSSVIGPLLGGFLVDQASWRWVFYINVIPGLLAATLVWIGWVDKPRHTDGTRPAVDYAGAALLIGGVVALLLGLFELGTAVSWGLLGTGVVLLLALVAVERRAHDPVLPLPLFRDRLFAIACGHGLLAGWAVFGSASFVPLFAQAVLGTSATAAGATLMPQLIGWVGASVIGSRLLLRFNYRTLALLGMTLLLLGAALMLQVGVNASQSSIMLNLGLMGVGMGLSIPAFLIAVQSAVPWRYLGTATSTLQFSRSIGGTLGVSVMGAILSYRLATTLAATGLDPNVVQQLLEPVGETGAAIEGTLRIALAGAIREIFVIALVAVVLGWIVTALTPAGQIADLAAERGRAAKEPTTHPVVPGTIPEV